MTLDTFLISILFDDAQTKASADKIDGIVKNLSSSIIKAFTAIASIDFLKNAIDSSVKLATQLNNLSYVTGISIQSLNAWGEAVKRNGGTVDQFYTSVSNLSAKIREIQTNYGSSGQIAFARLGINLKDASGHVKNAVHILGELGDKFKNLPKTWQLKLGEQLGLDEATIRLLASGNKEALQLVERMQKLGNLNAQNVKSSIQFRNAMYDLQLVWQSTKNTLSSILLPVLKTFTEYLQKSLLFLRDNPYLIQSALIAIAAVVSTVLIPAFLRLAVVMAPFLAIGAVIAGVTLVIQDLIVWLHGGESAFGAYYQKIADGINKLRNFITTNETIKTTIGLITDSLLVLKGVFVGVMDVMGGFASKIEEVYSKAQNAVRGGFDSAVNITSTATNSIKNTISNIADSLGFDKNKALTIANIESSLNPNAKSKTSSASGLFQLIDSTAQESGIKNLANKNDPVANANAGILNLKKTNAELTKVLGRTPSGAELYLGHMLGINGSKQVLQSDRNTPLSSLLSASALKANPQFRNQTSGQLINNANKTYQNKSITMGDVNISAPGADAQQISQHVSGHLRQQLSSLVTNIDNGVKQ